jgi:hypothetical protein
MKRLFLAIAAVVGIWLLGSFAGTMLDPARADLWTTSLMWALLSCVVLAPILLFFGTDNSSSTASPTREQTFEVEDSVDVPEEESRGEAEKEGWPYTE